MIKHLLASTALAAALAATPALATHHGVEGDPDMPGKSEHAPGQQAKDGELSARQFAPGQRAKETENSDLAARDFAPGQHDAGENGVTSNGNGKRRQ